MQELLLGIWEEQRKTVLFVTHVHPRHYSVKTTPVFATLKAELTEQVRIEVLATQAAMT